MNSNYSDITIILDKSGSMESLKTDTIGGFNGFLNAQKLIKGDKTLLTLIQFSYENETTFNCLDIQSVEHLSPLNYIPGGGTALFDAIGDAITSAGKRFAAMPEYERPGKVLVVIITDGEENSSRRFNQSQIKNLIQTQQDTYQWQFVFLGANQDAFKSAEGMGVARWNVSNYVSSAAGMSNAFCTLSSNTSSYRVSSESAVKGRSFMQEAIPGVDNSKGKK